MTEPRRPRELDETLLDEGRERLFAPGTSYRDTVLERTVLDEGRPRLAPSADADPLPPPLAERYKRVRQLDVPASQADLLLVRDRESGEELVLKRYRTGHEPHPDVVSYLSTPRAHVVRYREHGPGHEVMEYVPGGSLREWREAHPEAGFATWREIVQQVAAVLIDLHRHGLAHRDVKPVNLLVRATSPLDLAVVDFGVAGPAGDLHPLPEPNPAYQPPESIRHRLAGIAGDWWALGMTLLELAAGVHPFTDLSREDILWHFDTWREVGVAGIHDEVGTGAGERRDRLRSLCQGLLFPDPARRWGEREVSDWLVGRNPEVPGFAHTPDPGSTPFHFRGHPCHRPDVLAQELATAWNHAVEALVNRADRLAELRTWLDQFDDHDAGAARQEVDRAIGRVNRGGQHVRLLRILHALDPARPPVYRNHWISRENLRRMARQALVNEGDAASVLSDMWEYRLLPTFDAAIPAEPGAGGEALGDLDGRWRAEMRRWYAGRGRVIDPGARAYLARRERRPDVRAVCMRAALNHPEDVTAARDLVRETEAGLPVPLPWFSALAGQPELVWMALLLTGYATSRARTAADRLAAQAAEAEARRARRLFRAWSDRQNRPVALGWAAAGVCLMAAGWVALIAASDAAGWAGDTAIGLAWVGAPAGAAVSLVVECRFAAEVGGRFHPRYSIPGAGGIALGPLGRWMQRSWLPAAVTVLAGLAGIMLAALRYPQLVVAGSTVAHLIWVVQRWHAWRAQAERERDEAATEADEDPRGPSDTDAAPVGTTGGIDP